MIVLATVDDTILTDAKELVELTQGFQDCVRPESQRTRGTPESRLCSLIGAFLRGLVNKPYRETTFTVYKADDPTESNQPFLLVVRTRRIVTHRRVIRSSERTSCEYRWILGVSSI
jgi:hypothetical protein